MPARLHHELIGGEQATAWLLLTHGIYGAGSNWRGIARKLVARRPGWGVALVDLRQHGKSEGGAAPHTIAACAADVLALIDGLADRAPIAALAGHSFGGKVVLATRARRAPRPIGQTWVLDASPGPRPLPDPDNSARRVLDLMDRLPARWARREDFVAAVRAEGHAEGLAQWLALNLVAAPDGDGLVSRLDLVAIRAMLDDYYATDLWPSVIDPSLGAVEVVLATRSATVPPADRARLADAPPHVHVHEIAAGHWLHIDAPEAVVEVIAAGLA